MQVRKCAPIDKRYNREGEGVNAMESWVLGIAAGEKLEEAAKGM